MAEQDMTDYEIVQRILAGEKELFGRLAKKYGHEIRVKAHRVTPREFDSEDVAQETFVRAYFRLKDFWPDGNFRAWLYGILRNVAGDCYRKAGKQQEVSLDELSVHVMQLAEDAPVAEEDQKVWTFLKDCMGGLSEKSRRLVEMRYQEGKTGIEIGSYLQATQHAVNMALMRIRRELRVCMEHKLTEAGQ